MVFHRHVPIFFVFPGRTRISLLPIIVHISNKADWNAQNGEWDGKEAAEQEEDRGNTYYTIFEFINTGWRVVWGRRVNRLTVFY